MTKPYVTPWQGEQAGGTKHRLHLPERMFSKYETVGNEKCSPTSIWFTEYNVHMISNSHFLKVYGTLLHCITIFAGHLVSFVVPKLTDGRQ